MVSFACLALACAPAPVSIEAPPAGPRPVRIDEASRLAELPPVYAYPWTDAVVRRHQPTWFDVYEPQPAWPDGLLVAPPSGQPPLETGDRLAVLQLDQAVSTVVVTDERCPPTAIDCLSCDARWATRVAGPRIDPRQVVALVGPVSEDTLEFAIPSADEPNGRRLVVTADGVALVRERECVGKHFPRLAGDCETTTAFVLGSSRRELARTTMGPRAAFQVFRLRAWPDRSILHREGTIGGPGQVVLGEWSSAPDAPIRDASYWLIGPAGVVGSVRFDAPYTGAHCGFMTDPCWSTTAVSVPPPGVGAWFVVGPVSDSSPDPTTITQARLDAKDYQLDLRIGDPEHPWASISAREFACYQDRQSRREIGICFETHIDHGGVTTRHLSFLSLDDHHARPQSICMEQSVL